MVPEVSRISVLSSGRCHGSNVPRNVTPSALGAGGQTLPIRSARRNWLRVGREQRDVEVGPEPGDEEHHLGGDEQDHAVAVRDLHHAGVIAAVLGFLDDVAPPARHGVEHADRARAEHQRRDRVHVVHPADRADRHHEGRQRADDRPRARIDEVVVVLRFGVSVGHIRSPLNPRCVPACRPRRCPPPAAARRAADGRCRTA